MQVPETQNSWRCALNRLPRLALTGAILFLMSFAALSCSSDDDDNNPTGPGPTPADLTITIPSGSISAGNMAFSPNPATIQLGQTVSWKNNDGLTHTATGAGFNVTIGAGATSTPITITGATGDRAYQCTVGGHTMTGTLTVNP